MVDVDGSSTFEIHESFDDNVFLVVYHRNHLDIISANPLSPIDGVYENDFTTGSDKVYGGSIGYNEINTGIWGMTGGDASTNGIVDVDDKDIEWNDQAGETGYLYPDLNLDGQADNVDKNDIWLSNDGKGSQVPD